MAVDLYDEPSGLHIDTVVFWLMDNFIIHLVLV